MLQLLLLLGGHWKKESLFEVLAAINNKQITDENKQKVTTMV
jgi:hypothetical protein